MSWICITGGAQRIGAYLNKQLAKDGYNIVIHYNQSEQAALELQREILGYGVDCRLFQADLMNSQQIQIRFQALLEDIGQLDVLVNNASVFDLGNLQQASLSQMQQNFAIHLISPWLMLQTLKQHQQQGQIINLLDANLIHKQTHKAAYSISKQALAHFTELAAIEYAPTFRVNALAPGFVLPAADQQQQISQQEANLLQRYVPLADIYHGFNSLLNNPSLTGQIINIDAGSHLQCPPYMYKT